MAKSFDRKLKEVIAAVERRKQKEKAYLLWHPCAGETQEEVMVRAQEAGVFNPKTQ
jgi:hypothetical protein